ncbi:phosphopantothenoylcysteine decarboxylase [Bacteroidales bacterium]|nr:phosphopantothenoylcysteine decarboxylase [Bacteroidales bacterium]
MLKGKKIVVGICGSIAAYKSALLIRLLIKAGAEVQVVITAAGKEFITALTLSTLSQKTVICDFFASSDGSWNSHVDIGIWADLMIVAPATATSIGKMAQGIADNMLVTTYLSMKAPVFIAPAMDLDMFAHPATQKNIEILKSYGNHIIEPSSGFLASKLEGKGRMQEPQMIFDEVSDFFNKNSSLKGKKILITAGPTQEKIDPVRYISNYSSGKMGFAIAEACANSGAEVIVVAGPIKLQLKNKMIVRKDVCTADQMYEEAISLFPKVDIAILCAAVADYKPALTASNKIKRKDEEELTIKLLANKDIAQALGKIKKQNQVLVGFALETNDALANAKIKLHKKNLDFIVVNSMEDVGAGFQTDTNKISILSSDDTIEHFSLKTKEEVAKDIINKIKCVK